ncbi:acyltransferase [Kribbella sancticallisti]|uniref:Acyltransferase n=1 Tax=Kribbella sancticallisti TaxID=460087 RepID=A0ABN2DP87_9ACTN
MTQYSNRDAVRLGRSAPLDTLRTILVVWIIGGHAVLGYSNVGGWAYDEVSEVRLRPTVELVLASILGPTALFLMGTFFLIAGLFTPPALQRKGARRFVKERCLRLGVPFLASVVVIWPLCMWVAYRSAGRTVSYRFLLTGRERLVDSGGLWFAEVLLLFSIGYVALAALPWPQRHSGSSPFTVTGMVCAAALVTAATFLVRLGFSARGAEYLDLHVWQWPQLVGLFALGILGARHGLSQQVPRRLSRASGWIVVGCAVAAPVYAAVTNLNNLAADSEPYLGGWSGDALLLAAYEGLLVVFGSLWLLGFAQRRLVADHPVWHRLRRSSFAAFVLQGPVLILLAVALRPIGVPAEVKAVVVLLGGLFGCFMLGWLLVTRTRIGRIV